MVDLAEAEIQPLSTEGVVHDNETVGHLECDLDVFEW